MLPRLVVDDIEDRDLVRAKRGSNIDLTFARCMAAAHLTDVRFDEVRATCFASG